MEFDSLIVALKNKQVDGVIAGMTLPNGEEPENPTDGDYYTFVSANVCWMGNSGWSDFQIAFTDANGVEINDPHPADPGEKVTVQLGDIYNPVNKLSGIYSRLAGY